MHSLGLRQHSAGLLAIMSWWLSLGAHPGHSLSRSEGSWRGTHPQWSLHMRARASLPVWYRHMRTGLPAGCKPVTHLVCWGRGLWSLEKQPRWW